MPQAAAHTDTGRGPFTDADTGCDRAAGISGRCAAPDGSGAWIATAAPDSVAPGGFAPPFNQVFFLNGGENAFALHSSFFHYPVPELARSRARSQHID